ncbi:MAG: hypothetical protein KDD67_10675 [Ignavibacteriae bacterium]|nr:hypothetical protein [Ignavibacteriota bacterium]MCB9217777.1 hypothetical protein [Ignavibacteria bacterium]
MWDTLYHLVFYPLFVTAMRLVALWSPKIRRALKGRTDWRGPVSRIPAMPQHIFRIHFHVSSVGEFEQAIPLIELLRNEPISYRITVSFFSSSGYDHRKGFPLVDGVCYLPHDRQSDMNEFMNRLSPDLVIIIRYDLWPEFVRQTEIRKIPTLLLNGVLRKNSIRFFPLVRAFFSALYGRLTFISAVEEEDVESFRKLAPDVPAYKMGDTRYDRVWQRLQRRDFADEVAFAQSLAGERLIVVAGSTWPEDERLLESVANDKRLFILIVPHEPTHDHVSALCDRMPNARTLSDLFSAKNGIPDSPVQTLIIDRLGLLAELYRIGDIAWVGGGFGAGVHSLLEPAACGLPLMSGPKIDRSRDAAALREEGLLKTVVEETELKAYLNNLIEDEEYRKKQKKLIASFVQERVGATEEIVLVLRERGWLPNHEMVKEQQNELPSVM